MQKRITARLRRRWKACTGWIERIGTDDALHSTTGRDKLQGDEFYKLFKSNMLDFFQITGGVYL